MVSPSLRRLCQLSRLICILASITLPLFILSVWTGLVPFPVSDIRFGPLPNSAMLRTLGVLLSLIPAFILSFGLWRLARVFAEYANGAVLRVQAAHNLRIFALCLMIQAIITPVVQSALSVLLTWEAEIQSLSIMISSTELATLIFSILLLVLASTLQEATRLAEEQRLIV